MSLCAFHLGQIISTMLGVVIGKCEMSSTHILQEKEHSYSWSNVNL